MKDILRRLSLLTIVLLLFLLLSSCTTTTPAEIETITTQITYKIGDVGPAQGLIFFDKGEFLDGWRYLEVAPATTEVSLQWSSTESLVDNTSVNIGEGKNNTKLIIDSLTGNEFRIHAATYCDELSINGYDDWFLPSLGELDLIYWNLSRVELGELKTLGFGYWSSSEFDENLAWAEGFNAGVQGKIKKTEQFLVRAIRAF